MGRERQFEEAEVLHAATQVFAAHGYQGTSLAMLLEVTGLGKQSLYNAFGDKRALYLKAMDCAVSRMAYVQRLMQQAPTGRAAIDRFFGGLLGQCSSADAAEKTCVVSSGLLEAIDDAEIRHELLDKWQLTHEMLRAAIERGQKDGSIANPLASAALADLLMSLMSGMRVSARAAVDPDRLHQVAGLGLSILDLAAGAASPRREPFT
jgi:TetR/AcrR family transcriptional repressor of nem operon